MPNHVSLNPEGFTELIFEGPQTADSMLQVIQESLQYNNQLSQQGKPIKSLLDATKMTSLDPGAAKQAIGGASTISFDKSAIFGANVEIREKLIQILSLSGKNALVQLFDTRDEAVIWLQQ